MAPATNKKMSCGQPTRDSSVARTTENARPEITKKPIQNTMVVTIGFRENLTRRPRVSGTFGGGKSGGSSWTNPSSP